MKQLLTLVRIAARMTLRSRQAIIWGLGLPAGMMILWEAISHTVRSTSGETARMAYTGWLMGGMIVVTVLFGGMTGTNQWMGMRVDDGWRWVRCTPLPVWKLLLSLLIVQAAQIILGSALVIAIAVVGFHIDLTTHMLSAAFGPLFLASAVCAVLVLAARYFRWEAA